MRLGHPSLIHLSFSATLSNKQAWQAQRQKEAIPEHLHGKLRGKERRKINARENTAHRDQLSGKKITSSSLDAQHLRMSSTGWMGRSFPVIPGSYITRDWRTGAIFEKLREFLRVQYEQ